jgi:radical SAM superfamily enzyme YgiQ (UPF0313 family)
MKNTNEAAPQGGVLLLHPGVEEYGHSRLFPPWGAFFVAQALQRQGIPAWVADLNGEPELEPRIEVLLEQLRPAVLGVTGKWGLAARRAARVLHAARERRPECRRVLGGPLASNLPAGSDLARLCHAILPGDGEQALANWIRSGCPDVRVRRAARDADLAAATLDWPKGLDLGPYLRPASASDLGVPTLFVSGARGCDLACRFCYLRGLGSSELRTAPARRLALDLAALNLRYGAEGFYFVDDALVSRARWRAVFCEAVAELDTRLRWGVDLPTVQATQSVLEQLWRGGCRALYMGLETLDDRLRSRIGKCDPAGRALAAIDGALALGFTVRVSAVLGWPGESAGSCRKTIEAVRARPQLRVDPFVYNPLPGNPLAADVSPAMPSDHLYTDFTPSAPNLSACSDEALYDAWRHLEALKRDRDDVDKVRE